MQLWGKNEGSRDVSVPGGIRVVGAASVIPHCITFLTIVCT